MPFLVAGALPKGKESTPNPNRDYWLLWDFTHQQSQTTEGQ